MQSVYKHVQPGKHKLIAKLPWFDISNFFEELSNVLSTAANVEDHAKLVADAYTKRRLISLAGEISQLAFKDTDQADEIMNLAEKRVLLCHSIMELNHLSHLRTL